MGKKRTDWITVKRTMPHGIIVISTELGTMKYIGYSKREAEKRYREEFDLVGIKLRNV